MDNGQQTYGDPAGGTPSSVGGQIRVDHFIKKALIELKKEQYFSQLADVTAMPKNMGKKIKRYLYVPLLDDANINDQGLDASGASTAQKATIQITAPGVLPGPNTSLFAVGSGANAAAATTAAEADAVSIWTAAGVFDTNYATTKTAVEAAGWTVNDDATDGGATGTVPETGNLYGSSKDVGTIAGKMPVLSETGGRVNRVGFTRVELEGTIEKYGFFEEYTKESLDFDSDAELQQHINREMIFGANEMTEDLLQIDLLQAAGVIMYAGTAIVRCQRCRYRSSLR
jgi:N4-gp56 family major capsid protein